MAPFVKICGISRLEDAEAATRFGADALGFVAYPPSPRFVAPETVRDIVCRLSAKVRLVGVFVNASEDTVRRYLDAGLNTIQLHGDETPAIAAALGKLAPVWRAERPRDELDIAELKAWPAEMFLIDAFNPKLRGGAGQVADWRLARLAAETSPKPVLLAGGLNADNVAAALDAVQPFGVDASSGVEVAPGVKDPEKIRRFLETVKGRSERAGA